MSTWQVAAGTSLVVGLACAAADQTLAEAQEMVTGLLRGDFAPAGVD